MSPVSRLKQMTRQEVPPSVAVVTKTLSFQTMGEDQDSPGISVFQATFSVVDHLVGRLVSVERPWPVGPRKRGQFSAEASARRRKDRITAVAREIMGDVLNDQ